MTFAARALWSPLLALFAGSLPLAAHAVGATALEERIAAIARETPGHVGAAAMLLETGEGAGWKSAEHFPMQSVYKLPISMAALAKVDRGELQLDQKIRVTKDDLVPESMHSPLRDQHPTGEVELSVAELLERTIAESDGTTSDVLLRLAGGGNAVEAWLRELPIDDIKIATTEKEMGFEHALQYRNWGTPDAFLQLLRALHEGRGLSEQSRALLLKLMTQSKPGPRRLKGLLPPDAVVAHKTGTSGTQDGVTAACNDVGLLTLPNGRHVAVAVFVSDSPADAETREGAIAKIARAAWEHWGAARD